MKDYRRLCSHALAVVAMVALFIACGSSGESLSPVGDAVAPDTTAPDTTVEEGFSHEILVFTADSARDGLATGDFYAPALVYGTVDVEARYEYALSFQISPMLPPDITARPSHGPLVVYTEDLDTIVLSPLDHFFSALVWREEDGRLGYGLQGDVNELPADFTHRFLLVRGKGINRTIERWGDLLRADRGRERIDRYADLGLSHMGYLPHARPLTTATWSAREGLGRWTYLAAYHIAEEHPQRGPVDILFARVNYDTVPLEETFHYPAEVTDWRIDLVRDLGIEGPVVAYDWRNPDRTMVVDGAMELAPFEDLYDFTYYVLVPILENGLALIGEAEKFVTMADRRFEEIEIEEDGIRVRVKGVPGERVALVAYDTRAEALLDPVELEVGEEGTAAVSIFRP